ncbi:MAG: glycosyl hydrolase 53 family protein [Planctomycetota bacterium]|nr:glycosyl hydrolase 53 family protein [Planctomycetota bacterium]
MALPITAAAAGETAAGFIAGVDFSHVALYESLGKVYRDGGQKQDPFKVLKDHGITCVRLRLFTSSAEQARQKPYDSINNLDYTLPVAVRVKQAGLRFMLDFHYSDSWADPGKQGKPAAWKDLSFEQLEQRMYEYSRDCIAAFKKAGALPDYVQVGNEITPGMVWPDGQVGGRFETPTQWAQLGRLMKAAIRGIKEAAGDRAPAIIVHIDRGGDWGTTKWFFDNLRKQEVEFDIIGESYYPFWHGTLDNLRTCLNNAVERYGKPVMVVETGFPWIEKDANGKTLKPIVGIAPGKEGQVTFVEELAKVVKGVPGGKGLGVCWWAAEFQPMPGTNLGGFDGRSFFDFEGNALPVLDAFGRLARP